MSLDIPFHDLQPGHGLIVKLGNHETQYVMVMHWTQLGTLIVRRWLKASQRWSGPVGIGETQIIRRAWVAEHPKI